MMPFVLVLLISLLPAPPQQQEARSLEFVRIEPGEFMMGCSPGDMECTDEERPAHQVRIRRAYEIGKYEVTQAEWQSVMGAERNYSMFKGANRPVENVSWRDAQEFASKLNARDDGYFYRLPTEAEWEYAARAGTTGPYPGDALDMGWYYENSNAETHPVGTKKPNAWGLYDMSGNVYEWTYDWYDKDYYQSSPQTNPTGPPSGRFHTIRSGSWVDSVSNARVSKRDYFEDAADFHIGFRLIRESSRLLAE